MIPRILLVLGLLAGCGGSDGLGGRPGGDGTGATAPECGALDQVCIGQPLDAPLVLGGVLELALDYQVGGSSGPPLTVDSADPTVVETIDADLLAAGVGVSAILFVGPDDQVVDFLHVWVAPAEELRILRWADTGDLLGRVQPAIQLLVGDELLVSVEPYAAAQPLLGNFALERAVTGTAVAVIPDPVAAWYRLVAREVGAATVTFSGVDLDAAIEIEVLP
jgi:hypothetical protein